MKKRIQTNPSISSCRPQTPTMKRSNDTVTTLPNKKQKSDEVEDTNTNDNIPQAEIDLFLENKYKWLRSKVRGTPIEKLFEQVKSKTPKYTLSKSAQSKAYTHEDNVKTILGWSQLIQIIIESKDENRRAKLIKALLRTDFQAIIKCPVCNMDQFPYEIRVATLLSHSIKKPKCIKCLGQYNHQKKSIRRQNELAELAQAMP